MLVGKGAHHANALHRNTSDTPETRQLISPKSVHGPGSFPQRQTPNGGGPSSSLSGRCHSVVAHSAPPPWVTAKPADSLDSPFRELDLNELWDGIGKTRVRQHVNPLRRDFQTPPPPPDWASVYADPTLPLALDVGSGYGRFLLLLQRNNPERRVNYLGVEIRRALVERSNEWVARIGLTGRVHYVFANATVSLATLLAGYPGPLSDVFIQFPDPHFKRRHHKRRVVQPQLVGAVRDLMQPGGRLLLQSDVEEVTVAMRNMFERHAGDAFELAPEHRERPVFFSRPVGPSQLPCHQQQHQQQHLQPEQSQRQQPAMTAGGQGTEQRAPAGVAAESATAGAQAHAWAACLGGGSHQPDVVVAGAGAPAGAEFGSVSSSCSSSSSRSSSGLSGEESSYGAASEGAALQGQAHGTAARAATAEAAIHAPGTRSSAQHTTSAESAAEGEGCCAGSGPSPVREAQVDDVVDLAGGNLACSGGGEEAVVDSSSADGAYSSSLSSTDWEGGSGSEVDDGDEDDDIDAMVSEWAAGGWLVDNPVGTPTEREHYVGQQGLPVYRVLLVRR